MCHLRTHDLHDADLLLWLPLLLVLVHTLRSKRSARKCPAAALVAAAAAACWHHTGSVMVYSLRLRLLVTQQPVDAVWVELQNGSCDPAHHYLPFSMVPKSRCTQSRTTTALICPQLDVAQMLMAAPMQL